MVTEELFLTGMKYLKNLYPSFGLDITNTKMLEAWYNVLKNMEVSQFNLMITTYAENEPFAPQSPAHLLKSYREQVAVAIEKNMPKPDEVWNIFKKYRERHGGMYYPNSRKRVLEALDKDYPIIGKVAREMAHDLAEMSANDPFIIKRFKELYKEYVEDSKRDNTLLQIGIANTRTNVLLQTQDKLQITD